MHDFDKVADDPAYFVPGGGGDLSHGCAKAVNDVGIQMLEHGCGLALTQCHQQHGGVSRGLELGIHGSGALRWCREVTHIRVRRHWTRHYWSTPDGPMKDLVSCCVHGTTPRRA